MPETHEGRILLVDDEKHLLVSLRDCLQQEGFEVSVASSGEEALESIERGSDPELVILDISMPGMGGLGFLRRISDEEGHPRLGVLVLTARSRMEEFFSTVSVDGFLAKPCEETELIRKVREIIARRRRQVERQVREHRKVLLGESDPDAASRIRRALEAQGFEVVVMSTGPEVLEAAPAEKPDLVVLKEIMPRLNGSAVASLLGVMPSLTGIPVLIYDETLGETDALPARYTSVRAIRKVVRTAEAARVAASALEVIPR